MSKRLSRSVKLAVILAVSVFASLVLASSFEPVSSLAIDTTQNLTHNPNLERVEKAAKAIIAACPLAAPDDAKAFAACAEKLSKSEILEQTANDEFLWGQQEFVGNYDLKKNQTTLFNPLVWRRLYLATFMFPGTYQVEQAGNRVILHLPVQFRNQLDMGAYPYPFWHSKKKWDSYQTCKELLFVMEGDRFFGVLRSAQRDDSRANVTHNWDGRWQWTESGQFQPAVTLYTKLLSPSNPYTADLDRAFRTFEAASRPFSCATCHSPDNLTKMNPLILFNYPNQALSSRHEIVTSIVNSTMPPAAIVIEGDRKIVTPPGIADAAQKEKLIQLAKAFAEVGDKALAYEKQNQSSGTTKSRGGFSR